MTELDKQIIDIIEPYMDKKKSKGCLISCEVYDNITAYEINLSSDYGEPINPGPIQIEEIVDEMSYQNDYESFTYDGYDEFYVHVKTIGHYDITAVLKYILQKNGDGNSMIMQDYIHIYQDDVFVHEIPNKPLHLYSEQEKKDLLTLLTQLKGQD